MTPTASFLPIRRQVLILAALFVLSLPLVTTRLYASDEVQYFSYLRSLWFDHDVSFENEYQHFYDAGTVRYPGFHQTFLERETETGRRVTFATIGSALLWSPFYAAADGYVRVARQFGSPHAADGYAPPYVAAVAYGSAFYAWMALLCGLAIARRVLLADLEAGAARARTERWIFGAVLAIWIGTPLFFYMYIAPPMAHACSAFAVGAFVLVWLHVRERWCLRGLILLGALAALAGMTREQDLFIAIGPALDWTIALWRQARAGRIGSSTGAPASLSGSAAPSVSVSASASASASTVRTPAAAPSVTALLLHALAGAAAFLLAYMPQLAAYMALHGYPGPSRLVARKMNLLAPHALGVLASPQHGLFFWTPLVVLALAGLIWLALARTGASHASRDRRLIALCALAIVASQVYIAGSVESWTVAGAFGQRRFVGLSSIFILGLAALLTQLRADAPRRVVTMLALVAIWWNLAMMAQFGTGLMDRQRLELGRNAYNAFVTIPLRVPELAYRYVFARGSFYKPPASSTPAPGASPSSTAPSEGTRLPREPHA